MPWAPLCVAPWHRTGSEFRRKDTPTVVEMAYPVGTADEREVLRTRIVRSAGQLLVDGFQGGGMNMYKYLAISRNWLLNDSYRGGFPSECKTAASIGDPPTDCVQRLYRRRR